MKKGQEKKKAWQWDGTSDRVSSEAGCGLVDQTSISHPRGRVFDPAAMLLLLFFSCLSSIHFFLLFVLFCFIYNIYRTTYLREIIFHCTTHNERSFFLFQYLTNYLNLKLRTNENNERLDCSGLKGHKPLAYVVTEIPLLSL